MTLNSILLESFFSGPLFMYLVALAVGLFIYYHFLRYTFDLHEFKRKADYTNRLLELILTKANVTKKDIETMRTLYDKETEGWEEKEKNKDKDDSAIQEFINKNYEQ